MKIFLIIIWVLSIGAIGFLIGVDYQINIIGICK